MEPRRIATFAVLAAALAVAGPAALGAGIHTTETYQALQGQVSGGQVVRATINKLPHDVKATLKDGSIQTVRYPSAEEKQLEASLRSHGVLVKFAKRHKKKAAAAHHHLRYIAGGLLAALIVIGGGAYVVSRRNETAAAGNDAAPADDAPRPPPPAQDPPGTT